MEKEIQETWNKLAKHFDMLENPLKRLFKDGKPRKHKNVLFIAHGDVDGIMALVMFFYIFHKFYENIEILFTQPYYIHKWHNFCEVYDLIIVLDLAIDNRNDRHSTKFLDKYQNKVIWIDHHISTIEHSCYINNESFESCVYFLRALFPNQKFNNKINKLIEIAHKTDRGDTHNIYNRALKVNQKNDETRKEIFEYAMGIKNGAQEKKASIKLQQKSLKYDEMERNTYSLYNDTTRTKIYDLVTIIDNRRNRKQHIDKTLLAFTCYEKTPFMIYKFFSKPKLVKDKFGKSKTIEDEYTTITCDRRKTRTNVAGLFGYKHGAKYRITRPNFDKSKMTDIQYVSFLSKRHIPK